MSLDAIEKRAREALELASHCSAGPWHIGHLDENLDHAEIEDDCGFNALTAALAALAKREAP